jgi:hypothetical protein
MIPAEIENNTNLTTWIFVSLAVGLYTSLLTSLSTDVFPFCLPAPLLRGYAVPR